MAKTLKKTPSSARNLPYPKVTPGGAPVRPQRHVFDSIPTLRWYIAVALAQRLACCPCCGSKPEAKRRR